MAYFNCRFKKYLGISWYWLTIFLLVWALKQNTKHELIARDDGFVTRLWQLRGLEPVDQSFFFFTKQVVLLQQAWPFMILCRLVSWGGGVLPYMGCMYIGMSHKIGYVNLGSRSLNRVSFSLFWQCLPGVVLR